jgi:Flp pilus assembly protein TadB
MRLRAGRRFSGGRIVTGLVDQVLLATAGAVVGAGVAVLWRTLGAARPDVSADMRILFAPPATAPPDDSRLKRVAARITDRLLAHGWHGALLVDDLAIAERSPDRHMTTRLIGILGGGAAGLIGWVTLAMIVGQNSLLGGPASMLTPGFACFGSLLGLLVVDRGVKRTAHARRREARLAVAAYIDLVRILIAGGLTLQGALTSAADQGHGWTFDQLREALTWSRDHGAPPDEGLRRLGARIPVPELADLASTITAARRGASPIQALDSKAAFMRGAHSAQVRAEAAIADAQIELPAAAVGLAFVAFLTYPFITMINSTTGVTP